MLGAASLLIGGSLHAWIRTQRAATERVVVALIYAAGFTLIAIITYLVNLVRSAAAIYEEQQEEVKRLDDALNAYSKSADLAEKLVELA